MMAETKGRGGKKPKYQIADIGGSDLTSEDISTERVLNFLIKGAGEQSGPQAGGTERETTAPPAPPSTQRVSPPDEASSDQPAKKSLDHLFMRAGSGTGPAKDLKLKLSEAGEESVPSPAAAIVPPPQPPPAAESVRSGPNESARRQDVIAPPPAPLVEPPPAEAVPAEAAESDFDLTPYVELWKNFYRLKSGEIEALSTLFRMSHGEGHSECHVKMRKLAEMSNLDYRYCQKVVRSLERLGWLTKLQDYDPLTQLGVLYHVNLKPTQVI
jgi:hypothetical protein